MLVATLPASWRRSCGRWRGTSAWRRWTESIACWPPRRIGRVFLSLKILTLMDMKDMQSLEETVTTFVKVAPDNRTGPHLCGVAGSAQEPCQGGGRQSCRRPSTMRKESFPGELYDAIGTVAQALAADNKYVAARGHLLFRAMIGDQDEDAIRPLDIDFVGEWRSHAAETRLHFCTFDARCCVGEAISDVASKDLCRGAWRSGLRLT